MSLVVVDPSAALAWLLKSQATAASNRFLVEIDAEMIAPAIFSWEVGNVLLKMLLKGKISDATYKEALGLFAQLSVRLAEPHHPEDIEYLARRERLSLFDGAYLAYALVEGAALASRDGDLLSAAHRNSLLVWDLR